MTSLTLKSAVLALALAAGAAQAGGIEDAFRSFIDGLKAKGQSAGLLGGPLGAKEITQPVLEKRSDTLPLGKNQFVLFVADGCRQCPAVAAQLQKKHGAGVEVMNVSRNATARDAFVLSKARGVPALLMGNQLMSGYSEKMYKQALVQMINDQSVQMQGQGS